MNKFTHTGKRTSLAILVAWFSVGFLADPAASQNTDPLEVLMITGGGPFHDYYTQKRQLEEGLTDRIGNIKFTIDHNEGEGKQDMAFKFESQLTDEWARRFDLVLYNNCNLDMGDAEHVKQVMNAHAEHQVPAVLLHCPMHLHRTTMLDWYDFTGAVSYQHEVVRVPFTVEVVEPNHPIMANFPGTWRTPQGELYMPIEMKDKATPLARAYSVEGGEFFPIAWTHEYEGVRVFASTLGHHNPTMGSDVNLNLVAAGLLWAAGKLDDNGHPSAGYSGERGLGWISLWGGETMDGWRASKKTNWAELKWWEGTDVWPSQQNTGNDSFQIISNRVESNAIVVEGPQSYLFYTGPIDGGDFKNFEFKVDVYTYPGSAAGVYFHTRYKEEGPPTFGYEAQINASRAGESKTGSLVGAREVKTALHGDNEWFSYYIKVDGKKVTVKVNGDTVNEYTEPADVDGPASLRRGTIALESVGSDSRVYFRNPMIRLLPD
jgi:type 1 glutamine amidotransferase